LKKKKKISSRVFNVLERGKKGVLRGREYGLKGEKKSAYITGRRKVKKLGPLKKVEKNKE